MSYELEDVVDIVKYSIKTLSRLVLHSSKHVIRTECRSRKEASLYGNVQVEVPLPLTSADHCRSS